MPGREVWEGMKENGIEGLQESRLTSLVGIVMHRSRPQQQDRLHQRATMHRLRYLSEEVPLRRHPHHQLAHQPRDSSHAPLLGKLLQIASPAYATPRTGAGIGWNEWYWQEHGVEDSGREIEAKLGEIQ